MLQETAKESIVKQKFQGKEGWAVEMKDIRGEKDEEKPSLVRGNMAP